MGICELCGAAYDVDKGIPCPICGPIFEQDKAAGLLSSKIEWNWGIYLNVRLVYKQVISRGGSEEEARKAVDAKIDNLAAIAASRARAEKRAEAERAMASMQPRYLGVDPKDAK